MTEAAVAETQVKQGPVTFYHWMDKYPCSEIFRLKGGERRLGTNGEVFHAPMLEARFHNGMFTTSDPEAIQILRELASNPSAGLTEDKEVYYSHVMTEEQRVRHLDAQNKALAETNANVLEENSRLKQQIEKMNRGK